MALSPRPQVVLLGVLASLVLGPLSGGTGGTTRGPVSPTTAGASGLLRPTSDDAALPAVTAASPRSDGPSTGKLGSRDEYGSEVRRSDQERAVDRPGGRASEATTPPALPWIHVAHPADGSLPFLADPRGRQVLLRGVDAAGLVDYWTGAVDRPPYFPIDPAAYDGRCPTNVAAIEAPPLCEVDDPAPALPADTSQDDIAQMHANGVDVIRLALSWSLLEPVPGTYSRTYLDRVAQVVGWARRSGIYVLLDMHQDAYSRYLAGATLPTVPPVLQSPRGYDGAPCWAVVTDGAPIVAVDGVRELDPAVQAAFTAFWLNRPPRPSLSCPRPPVVAPEPGATAPGTGLQDHYIGALAALARRFRDDSTVLGYEVMNEPSPGFLGVGAFEASSLFPFYRRVIDAITGSGDGLPCPASFPAVAACGYPDLGIHDTRHLVFVEPSVVRNLLDAPSDVESPFTSYANLVFAPHVYTHVFTVDAETGLPLPVPISYDQAYRTATLEATALHAALFVTEFGDNPPDDGRVLAQQLDAQDRALVSATVWIWKENCNDVSPGNSWGMYAGVDPAACARGGFAPVPENGPLRPLRLLLLDRAHAVVTAGRLMAQAYDPGRSFRLEATADRAVRRGDSDAETVVVLPRTLGGEVRVTGNAVLDRVVAEPDGSRRVFVAPTGGGTYDVVVG